MIRLLLLLAMLTTTQSFASLSDEVVPIWPEGVPGVIPDGGEEQWDGDAVRNVHNPTITVYRPDPDKSVGTAVVVCPGGGYGTIVMAHEGWKVASWFNDLGVTAFVLRYRHHAYGHPHPLRDVSRAIRMVRSRAGEFGIEPDRIGVLGFSAGGHLASSATTLYDHADGKTGAKLDAVSARPDFSVLVYPVISMLGDADTHEGSRNNLIGEDASEELEKLLTTYLQVTPDTPPTMLIHAGDDQAVVVQNSIRFYQALVEAGVPAALHVYEKGGHGFGMNDVEGPVSTWTARVEDWMRFHGWVD